MKQIIYLFILLIKIVIKIPFVQSIRCYECSSISSGGDKICSRYVGTSCNFGFFGCVKVATYDGGVDKMGNFINDPTALVSMVRGCNILPLGGVDACQQQVFVILIIVME
ncbi:hypothetical protein Mgra_00005960 [Meloidogyne graminicola]|uniref:Uncharacterized protein n=1 Tax=Meloidogyne graminicola TaxID=189291 RepID=A0A8S9ZN26_9BILA|nr:hypothetical protein Mgra_00005960 [Meloidogyne graminicola]